MRKKGSVILSEFVNSTVKGTVLDLDFPSTYKSLDGSDMDKTIDWIASFVKLTRNPEKYEENRNEIERYLNDWEGGANMKKVFDNALKKADPAVFHAISSYADMLDMFTMHRNLLDTEYFIGADVSYQTLGGKKDAESGKYTVDADNHAQFVKAYKEIKDIQPQDPLVFVKNGKNMLLKNMAELSNIPNIDEKKKNFILGIGEFVAAVSEPNLNRFDVENKLNQLIAFDEDLFRDSYQVDEKTESDALKANRTVVQIKNILRNMRTGLQEFGVANSELKNTRAMLCEIVDNTEPSKNPLITPADFENVKVLVNVKKNASLDITKENEASITQEAEKYVKERLKNNIVGEKANNKEEIAFMGKIRKASLELSKEYKEFTSEEEKKAYDSKKEKIMFCNAFFREDNNLIDMQEIAYDPANDLRLENINHLNNIVYRKNSIYQNNPIADILDKYPGGRAAASDILWKAGLGCKDRNVSLLSNILVYAKMLNRDKTFEEISQDPKLIEEMTYKFIDFAKENRIYEDREGKKPLGDKSSRYPKLKKLSDYYKFAYHCFDDEVIGDLSNREENVKNFDRYELMNLIGIDINQDEQEIRQGSVKDEYLAHFADYKKDSSTFDQFIDVLAVSNKEVIGGEAAGISAASRAVLDYVAPLMKGKKVSEIDNPILSTEGCRAFFAMINPRLVKYAQSNGIPYQKLIDFGNGGENPFPKEDYEQMVNEAAKIGIEVAFDTQKDNKNVYAKWYEQHVAEENAKKAEKDNQVKIAKDDAVIEEIKRECFSAPLDNSLSGNKISGAYAKLMLLEVGKHGTKLFLDTVRAVEDLCGAGKYKSMPSDTFSVENASLTSTINKYVEARKDSKYPEVQERVAIFKNILAATKEYETYLLIEEAKKYDEEVKSGELKTKLPQKSKNIAALGNMMLIASGVTLEELRGMDFSDARMSSAYSKAREMLADDMKKDFLKKIVNNFEKNIVNDVKKTMSLLDKNGKPLNEEAKEFIAFSDRFLRTTGSFAAKTMAYLGIEPVGVNSLPRSEKEREYKKKREYIQSTIFDEHEKNTVRKPSEPIFSEEELRIVNNAGYIITSRKPSVLANAVMYKILQKPGTNLKDVVDNIEDYSDALTEYIKFEKENPVYENPILYVPLFDDNKRKESLKEQAAYYKKWYEFNNEFTLGNVKDPEYIRKNMNVFDFMAESLINCAQNEGSLLHNFGEEYLGAFGGRVLHRELVDSNRKYINLIKFLSQINNPSTELHFRAAAKMYVDLVADEISNKKVSEINGEYVNAIFATNYYTSIAQELSEIDYDKLRDFVENGTPFYSEKEMSELNKSVVEKAKVISLAAAQSEKESDEKATATSLAKASKKKAEANQEKALGEAVVIFDEHERLVAGMNKFMETIYSDISYQNPATGKEEIIGRRKQEKDASGKNIKDNSVISVESVFEKLVDKPLHEIVRPGAGEYMALGYALTKGLTMDEFNTFIDGRDKEKVAEITKKIKSFSQPLFDMVVNQKTDEMVEFFVDYCKSMKNCDEALRNCTSLSGIGKNLRNMYHLAGAHSVLCQTLNIGSNNQNAEQKAMVDKINRELGKEGMDLDSFSLYRMLGHSVFQYVKEAKPVHKGNDITEEEKKLALIRLSGALSCGRMFAKVCEETIENGRLSSYGEMGPSSYYFRICLTQRENDANNYQSIYQDMVNEIYPGEDALLFSDVLLNKDGDGFDMNDLLSKEQSRVYKMTDSEFVKNVADKDIKGVCYSKYEVMRYLDKNTTLVPVDLQPVVNKIRSGEDYSGFDNLPSTIKKMVTTEYVYKNSLVMSGNRANFVEVMAERSVKNGRNEFANPMLSYAKECGLPGHIVFNTEIAALYKHLSPEKVMDKYEDHTSALNVIEETEQKAGRTLVNNIFERKIIDGDIKFVPVFDKNKEYTREEAARIVGEKVKQNGEIFVFENESSLFKRYFGKFELNIDKKTVVPTKEQLYELGESGYFMSNSADDRVVLETEQADIDSFAKLNDEEKSYFVESCLRKGIPVRKHEQKFIEENLEQIFDYKNMKAIKAFKESGSVEDFNKLTNIAKNYVASLEYNNFMAYSENMRDFDSQTVWDAYVHFEHCANNPAVKHMKTNLIENEASRKDIMGAIDKHSKEMAKYKPDEKNFYENISLVCQNQRKLDNLNLRLSDIFLNGEPAVYFTDSVTKEKIYYHNEAEYSALGKKHVIGHPFSEAFDRNVGCHMRFFAMTSGISANDLLVFMNEPESQKALEVAERLKGLRQSYADFISGLDQEDIANRYIDYIETFNKEDNLIKNLDSFDKIAKQSDKLLLFSDTHSIFGQTLNYDSCSTENSYELIQKIHGKLAEKNTDFEHGTGMLYATGGYVCNKLYIIGQSMKYVDINANDINMMERALHCTALGEYISKVANANNLSLEESGKLPDVITTCAAIDRNMSPSSMELGVKSKILESNAYDYVLGRPNAVGFVRENIPILENVEKAPAIEKNKLVRAAILLDEKEKEKDPEKKKQLTEKHQEILTEGDTLYYEANVEFEDKVVDYREYNKLFGDDKGEVRNYLDSKLASTGIPNKYMVARFFMGEPSIRTAEEDRLLDEYRRNLSAVNFKNLGENLQKLECSRFVEENNGYFLSTDDKLIEFLNNASNTHGMKVQKLMELGCEDPDFGKRFREIDGRTKGKFTFAKCLSDLQELSQNQRTSELFDKTILHLETMVEYFKEDPTYQPAPEEYDALSKLCNDYIDKHYDDSKNSIGGKRRDVVNRVRDCCQNALSYSKVDGRAVINGEDRVVETVYTPINSFKDEMNRIRGGIFNTSEFTSMVQQLDMIVNANPDGLVIENEKHAYVETLSKLSSEAEKYLEAKGSDHRATDKGQKRYDLALKMKEYADNFVNEYNNDIVGKLSKSLRGNGAVPENVTKESRALFVIAHAVSSLGEKKRSQYFMGLQPASDWNDSVICAKMLMDEYKKTGDAKDIKGLFGMYKENIYNRFNKIMTYEQKPEDAFASSSHQNEIFEYLKKCGNEISIFENEYPQFLSFDKNYDSLPKTYEEVLDTRRKNAEVIFKVAESSIREMVGAFSLEDKKENRVRESVKSDLHKEFEPLEKKSQDLGMGDNGK